MRSSHARYSEGTAALIDEEVRRLLGEAHERVMRTLRERREPLERIARRLLESEVIDHETLLQMIGEAAPATVGVAQDVAQSQVEAVRS